MQFGALPTTHELTLMKQPMRYLRGTCEVPAQQKRQEKILPDLLWIFAVADDGMAGFTTACRRIIRGVNQTYQVHTVMEAERINAVANRISNLKMRAQELRRYL
jgi:hypothetical protein